MSCKIDQNCIFWPMPTCVCTKCDCLNLFDCDGVPIYDSEDWDLWEQAWQESVAYIYRNTGCRWPGKGWEETVRPCVDTCLRVDCRCGRYVPLDLSDAFCLEVCDIKQVQLTAGPCQPNDALWTPGDGVRLEWLYGCPQLVLEAVDGCCGTWPRQDLCVPHGAPGSWSITAITGCDPPPDILGGAAAMACWLVEECIAKKCKMSDAVTSATTRGGTFSFDPDTPDSRYLQMLQTELDKDPDPVEQFANPFETVRFHRVHGPRKLAAA